MRKLLPFQHSPIALTTVSLRLYSLQLSSTGRLAPSLVNFQEVAEERHEISCSVAYSHNEGLPEHSNVILCAKGAENGSGARLTLYFLYG